MHKEKLLALTKAILSQPTAPFHEHRVKAEIRAHLEKLRFVTLTEDSFGNLIARYSRGNARPKFAFAAHMDHPGWVRPPGAANGMMQFLGGVKEEFLDKCPIQSFGDFGMWNLPAFDLKDDKIYSRACDDLIGCAAIVAMMQELEENSVNGCVLGLFTRAEEVGFVGAIQLAKSNLLPKNIIVISLETSAEKPPAKMGAGPIIRVGDRTSVFEPTITQFLAAIARRSKIPFQRCLMPGGTCEATAYENYGLRTGALCVALANYHNCTSHNQIGREYVSYDDYRKLIDLCAKIATESDPMPNFQKDLRKNLEQNLKNYAAWIPEIVATLKPSGTPKNSPSKK